MTLNQGDSRRTDNERDGSNDPSIYPVSRETSLVRATLGAREVNDMTALGLDPGTMPMIINACARAHTHTHTHTHTELK